MNYEEELGIHSEEVQEVLGTPPKWIVRWGTTLSLFVLLLMAWLAWYIKYPEKLEAPITITSSIPPMDVVAQESGYLNQLIKENNDTVVIGDLLGVIESTTSYEDVLVLEDYLEDFEAIRNNDAVAIINTPRKKLDLDEDLQLSYSNFTTAYKQYTTQVEASDGRSTESRYRREIEEMEQSIVLEEQRKQGAEKRIRDLRGILQDKQDKYALERNMGSAEIEETSDQIENARRRRDQHEENIVEKALELDRLKGERASAIQQLRQDNQSSFTQLKERAKQLQSQIDAWKQTYVLTAPADGLVTYFGAKATALGFVNQGDVVMAILPLDTTLALGENEIVGRISLPIEGSGKVKEQQKVKVKLDSYPSHEYGLVEGIIVAKARMPRNRIYEIEVRFPKGLNTTFNSEAVSFDPKMTGIATILTGDQRFAERIFEKFTEIFE
ncbi:MAG: HlyD family efflux transporter periplasmic adaptor subunit [Bacteroidota bacterium]